MVVDWWLDGRGRGSHFERILHRGHDLSQLTNVADFSRDATVLLRSTRFLRTEEAIRIGCIREKESLKSTRFLPEACGAISSWCGSEDAERRAKTTTRAARGGEGEGRAERGEGGREGIANRKATAMKTAANGPAFRPAGAENLTEFSRYTRCRATQISPSPGTLSPQRCPCSQPLRLLTPMLARRASHDPPITYKPPYIGIAALESQFIPVASFLRASGLALIEFVIFGALSGRSSEEFLSSLNLSFTRVCNNCNFCLVVW